jgi:hypothetical protein
MFSGGRSAIYDVDMTRMLKGDISLDPFKTKENGPIP